MAVDMTQLGTALGNYSRLHAKDITKQLIYKMGSANGYPLSVWDIVKKSFFKDEKSKAGATFDIDVKDADGAFLGQGNVVELFGEVDKLRDMQSDFKVNLYTYENKWIEHLSEQRYIHKGKVDYKDIEFVPWFTEMLLANFMEKFALQSSFKGVYTAGYSYANSFPFAIDGVLKKIADAITAGTITNVVPSGGAITDVNAYDIFENLGTAVTPQMESSELFLLCSRTNADNYNKAYAAEHGNANVRINDSYKRPMLMNREIPIIPVHEMNGSDRVFITTRNNIDWGQDFNGNPPRILYAVSDPMEIKVTMLYSASMSIERPDIVLSNDLA